MFCPCHRAVIHPANQPLALQGIAAGPGVPPAAPIRPASLSYLGKKTIFFSHFTDNSQEASHLCCLPVSHRAPLISVTSGPSGMLPSNETLSPGPVTQRHSSAMLQTVLRFFKQAWYHRSQHVSLRCRDSSSQSATGGSWDSSRPGSTTGCTHPACVSVFQEKIFSHLTDNFRQAWGCHFHLCCLPVFRRAFLISATSGPSGMLPSNETLSPSPVTHRHSSAMLQTVLRFFQASLGPHISACFAQVP